MPAIAGRPDARWPTLGRALGRIVPVVNRPERRHHAIGALRLGGLVRVRSAAAKAGNGCRAPWLAVEPRGYVCPDGALAMGSEAPPISAVLRPPAPRDVLPHRYIKVTDRAAFRYRDPVPAAVRDAIRDGDDHARQDAGARALDGFYFLAIDGQEQRHGEPWLRTLEGNHVRAAVTEAIPRPKLVGEVLAGRDALPMAFVVEPDAPVTSVASAEVVGRADRYARVQLASATPTEAGMLTTRDGHRIAAAHVRVVVPLPAPDGLGDDERWLQINLEQQTLIAFEGSRPVYATLISSGAEEHATPTGLFDIDYKHLTVTMRGEDADGPFEVQEVPWVMYYDGAYAVHGAYWHDVFGQTRSHGCTNVAPADARHIFRFVRPDVPAGWHTASDRGSHVHITRSSI